MSALLAPIAALAADPSGYTPTDGAGGPNFGNRSLSSTLSVTTVQKLVCGLTLSTHTLNFGTHDYNSYTNVLGTPNVSKTVDGTVACNADNQKIKVTAVQPGSSLTAGYEQLSNAAVTSADDNNLVLNWSFNTNSAGTYNTINYTDLTTSDNPAKNIYSADFAMTVSAFTHIASEAVLAGTYTGAISMTVSTES